MYWKDREPRWPSRPAGEGQGMLYNQPTKDVLQPTAKAKDKARVIKERATRQVARCAAVSVQPFGGLWACECDPTYGDDLVTVYDLDGIRPELLGLAKRQVPGLTDPEEVVSQVLAKFTERRLWPVARPYLNGAIVRTAISALRHSEAEARKHRRLVADFDSGHRRASALHDRRGS